MNSENRVTSPASIATQNWAVGNSRSPIALGTFLPRHPDLRFFLVILILFNLPVLADSFFHSLTFQSDAVRNGQWWRLFTHPFVHLIWYHLLLDGTAFV